MDVRFGLINQLFFCSALLMRAIQVRDESLLEMQSGGCLSHARIAVQILVSCPIFTYCDTVSCHAPLAHL